MEKTKKCFKRSNFVEIIRSSTYKQWGIYINKFNNRKFL